MDMEDSEETSKVSALKWLADTGKLEQLQKQCEGYNSEAGKVCIQSVSLKLFILPMSNTSRRELYSSLCFVWIQ